jgi:hypothetical protein
MTACKLLLRSAVALLILFALFWSPDANANPDPAPAPPVPGIGQLPSGIGNPGFGALSGGAELGPGGYVNAPLGGEPAAPEAPAIFLCPGVGAAGGALGFGGGYCDFDFRRVALSAGTHGVMHTHCEWGSGAILGMWNCWRVFPGQPDHPALPDPDIVPDGYGVPWAIRGPAPEDQFPPPGLAPAAAMPPPEPTPGPLPPSATPEP